MNDLNFCEINWNSDFGGVEVKTNKEHFIIEALNPNYICEWEIAKEFFKKKNWKLPTKEQLLIVSKHHNEINKIMDENNSLFELYGWYLTSDEVDDKAVSVYIGQGWAPCNKNSIINEHNSILFIRPVLNIV